VHTGRCQDDPNDPGRTLEHLVQSMVRPLPATQR